MLCVNYFRPTPRSHALPPRGCERLRALEFRILRFGFIFWQALVDKNSVDSPRPRSGGIWSGDVGVGGAFPAASEAPSGGRNVYAGGSSRHGQPAKAARR